MCSYKNGKSMMDITRSSNEGDGLCCNPDNSNCKTNDVYVCSEPPLLEKNETSKFTDILSLNRDVMFEKAVNYQMFAFCPAITQATCGISRSNSPDMKLYADVSDK